jgi:outer membrane protein
MRLITFLILLFFYSISAAQGVPGKIWDLQTCIDAAIKNSLDVRSSTLNMEQNELNYKQSKYNRLPDFNVNTGLFSQSGRSIDRFTNTYVKNTITSNNMQASSNMVLFAGGQINNNIKYSQYAWLASEQDVLNVEMNISLNVANYFLQVAQARELKKSYAANLNNTKIQLDKAQKQYDAGVINEGNLLNLKAQQATDESNIITAQNQERTAMTNLKLLLRLPFEDRFDIELPSVGMLTPANYPDSLNTIFDSALSHRPDVQAAALRLSAYEFRKKSVKGALLPTLSAAANMSSVYSSSAKQFDTATYSSWYISARVKTTGDAVETPNWQYHYKSIGYGQQLKNNLGNWVGVTLSVPVFNKFQSSTNVKLAALDVERYQIAYERSKQNLYNEVVTAYNSFLSAMNRFKAAKFSLEAQNKNLDFVQKRYDAGQSGALDLQIAKASQLAAQVNVVSVQYEYIFRRLLLDYYMGQKLAFK